MRLASPVPVAHRAATTSSPGEFLAALDRDGLHPHPVLDPTGRPHGYTVTLPGDHTATGQPIRYSGSALATDLTWPKLLQRWASTPPVADGERGRVSLAARQRVLHSAAEAVHRSRAAVQDGAEDPDGVAHAAGELLTALGGAHDGRSVGELTASASRFDRAARTPHRVVPAPLGPLAADLRRAARQLGAIGAMSGRGHERLATAALILALASLFVEIAAWQQRRHRPQQATAARSAATLLGTITQASHRPAPKPAQPPSDLTASRAQRTGRWPLERGHGPQRRR